ncbi:DUF4350 domain-containing protein [Microbacterium sp. 18062]|uniref:DUF4350 domain-containing protein n=1 Tax=Microbacterium sp. 18062 TaxID=2681410 RepID=UPI00135C25CD|nr:DUF4350 domain-containing protein [Microbacterium sp. 18062]
MSAQVAPPRPRARGVTAWVAIAAVLVLVGTLGAVLASSVQWTARDRFDPESAGPDGTRALARILADHGIEVEVVRARTTALDALDAGPATLVLPDSALLSDETFAELADAATDVVVIEPRSRGIRLLFDGRIDGYGGSEPTAPHCDLGDAERAGPVLVGATFTADAEGCYPVGDAYGLVWGAHGEGRAVAVDGTMLFTNENLAENGNAALGVNLIGSRDRVVWFVPEFADTDGDPATLGDLTPGWVSPAIVLLLVTAIGTILWRGRRFGPLVRERLPVTVRGSETTAGRAHLYAQSRDVRHAATVLRQGAVGRLGRILGLPASASAEAVADAAAARLGNDRADIGRILITDEVRTDRDLVALTHRLHDLETALARALRPGKEPR